MANLNEPVRARLLVLVESHELNVGEISSVLQLPQSTTSRHLKSLSDDEWLASRREGTSRLYRLASEHFCTKRKELWRLVKGSVAEQAARDEVRLRSVLLERQDQNQAFFAGAASHWDRLRAELFGADLERRFLGALLPRDTTVLDLGCGTGRLAQAISPFVERVVAIDSSLEMVQAAEARLALLPNVQVQRAQMHELPLADRSVDLVLLVLVLHYVSSPAVALQEAARVLRPGGKLLLVDMQPHSNDEYRTSMGQLWLGFAPAQLTTWLLEAGLVDVRVQDLATESNVKGPGLFVCQALARPTHSPAVN
jgi:ubiquinone/menaquinone biosynthesis C-methylase UbiE/DNA-binding transcriptional ArsR family regulator